MGSAPFQSGTSKINVGQTTSFGGPGTRRVRLRNSGPVSVRVGDSSVSFDDGFLLGPQDDWLEIVTDDIVYAIGPPNAAGIGQAQLDYLIEN